MNNLQIDRVTGGFIVIGYDPRVPSQDSKIVTCCADTLLSIVGAWANDLTWVYPGKPTPVTPPPVAPDAAPAPFRVGDRVVRRDASQMVHYDNKPLIVVEIRNGGVVAVTHDRKVRLAFDNDELRHAPIEDL